MNISASSTIFFYSNLTIYLEIVFVHLLTQVLIQYFLSLSKVVLFSSSNLALHSVKPLFTCLLHSISKKCVQILDFSLNISYKTIVCHKG